MVGPCYVVHYLVASFAIISLAKKANWLFYFNCLLRCVSSSRCCVGWYTVYTVYNCDVSLSYYLLFM